MKQDKKFYGYCKVCGNELEPIWTLESEKKRCDSGEYRTGKTELVANELWCYGCLKKVPTSKPIQHKMINGDKP